MADKKRKTYTIQFKEYAVNYALNSSISKQLNITVVTLTSSSYRKKQKEKLLEDRDQLIDIFLDEEHFANEEEVEFFE